MFQGIKMPRDCGQKPKAKLRAGSAKLRTTNHKLITKKAKAWHQESSWQSLVLRTKNHKLITNRAVSPLLSWVILVGIAVVLGTFFFNWARSYTADVSKDITEKGDRASCDYMGMYVKGLCQNTQALYMNITNNNDLRIESFSFRLYDVHKNAEAKDRNITLIPGETGSLSIVKQGVLSEFEIIPAFFSGGKRLVCEGRGVRITSIPFCS